jgi:hypothetical protein
MKGYPFLRKLSSFAGRAVTFFFIVSALLFFTYALGNAQDFLDSTQVFLLSVLRISLGLEIICGVWLVGLLVYRNASERRPLLVRWVLLVLSMICCTAILFALRFVQQWL